MHAETKIKTTLKVALLSYGVLREIRTPDRRLRRALLYPAELAGHNQDTF